METILTTNYQCRQTQNITRQTFLRSYKTKMNSYFAYLQITMISMSEYLFPRRIMTFFFIFHFTGPEYLSDFIYAMPIQIHTLTSSSTCNFSFITGKLNSFKNVRARENRYGMHAVLNLTGNTFSKIVHKVGNISGTIRLYYYLRMNSGFFLVFFYYRPSYLFVFIVKL